MKKTMLLLAAAVAFSPAPAHASDILGGVTGTVNGVVGGTVNGTVGTLTNGVGSATGRLVNCLCDAVRGALGNGNGLSNSVVGLGSAKLDGKKQNGSIGLAGTVTSAGNAALTIAGSGLGGSKASGGGNGSPASAGGGKQSSKSSQASSGKAGSQQASNKASGRSGAKGSSGNRESDAERLIVASK